MKEIYFWTVMLQLLEVMNSFNFINVYERRHIIYDDKHNFIATEPTFNILPVTVIWVKNPIHLTVHENLRLNLHALSLARMLYHLVITFNNVMNGSEIQVKVKWFSRNVIVKTNSSKCIKELINFAVEHFYNQQTWRTFVWNKICSFF